MRAPQALISLISLKVSLHMEMNVKKEKLEKKDPQGRLKTVSAETKDILLSQTARFCRGCNKIPPI